MVCISYKSCCSWDLSLYPMLPSLELMHHTAKEQSPRGEKLKQSSGQTRTFSTLDWWTLAHPNNQLFSWTQPLREVMVWWALFKEIAGGLDGTSAGNKHFCRVSRASQLWGPFFFFSWSNMVIESAPPTILFFSEVWVFLVGGEGKSTKCSSSKAASAFGRAVWGNLSPAVRTAICSCRSHHRAGFSQNALCLWKGQSWIVMYVRKCAQ